MEKQLRPYQLEGVEFLASRRRAFLGDEMGLGKTAQAICAAMRILDEEEDGPILVICPASLRLNWQAEIKAWSNASVSILRENIPHSRMSLEMWTEFVIVSYNQLSKFHIELRKEEWLCVICDEAHYLQSLDSQRTIEVRGGWGRSPIPARRRWALTGTPLQNRPINLYPILKWLEVDGPYTRKEFFFGEHFCGGEKQQNRGATNVEELNALLKTVMLRRTKAEVLGELPAKTRQVIQLDLGEDGKVAIAEEKKILSDAGIFDLDSPSIFNLDKGTIARLRRNTGMAKIKAAAQFIVDALASVEKVLVFAHHRDVIDGVAEEIYRLSKQEFYPSKIMGGMNDADKDVAVASFQSIPKARILIGQIEAAGVGLTLTAASLVIFVEQDWTPGKNEQAADRVHRIGQKENVLIQYLVLNNSLDAHIARRNIEKQEVLDAVLA